MSGPHLQLIPHRRWNPLTGEWVLVSPHRLQRPWQGRLEEAVGTPEPAYDAACYLCPGNARAGGVRNPAYAETFVFTNDFAALMPGDDLAEGVEETGGEETGRDLDNLLVALPERGVCRVVCFSPRHDLSLARLGVPAIRRVVDTWTREYRELAARPYIGYVQIFENKGAIMGCSNPHPHGQIWATESVPVEPAKEDERQRAWFARTGRTLLADYLARETEGGADGAGAGERVVCANGTWVALVPYWAKWPFETLLLPRRAVPSLAALDDVERDDLAAILSELTIRHDNLFECSFPYTMGWHQAPTIGVEAPYWHLHAHFYPPLLRSASVRKFMVGFEMLATPQRDITPEEAARRLRALPSVHYLGSSALEDGATG